MSDFPVCGELGHQWPDNMLVLAIRPYAVAEITCARCGVVKTTIIDDESVHVRWTLSGAVIRETVEPKSPEAALHHRGHRRRKVMKSRSQRIERPWSEHVRRMWAAYHVRHLGP